MYGVLMDTLTLNIPDWYLAACLRQMPRHAHCDDETLLRVWRAYMAAAPAQEES